jgi:hypothetical protein
MRNNKWRGFETLFIFMKDADDNGDDNSDDDEDVRECWGGMRDEG